LKTPPYPIGQPLPKMVSHILLVENIPIENPRFAMLERPQLAP